MLLEAWNDEAARNNNLNEETIKHEVEPKHQKENAGSKVKHTFNQNKIVRS
jgi:hypothetical protein